MKFYKLIILVSILIITSLNVTLGSGVTYPLDHWTYKVIDELITRGYFHGLNYVTKPFSRNDLAKELIKIDSISIKPSIDDYLIQLLKEELNNELNSLRDNVYPQSKITFTTRLSHFTWNDNNYKVIGGVQGKLKLSADYGKYFTIHTTTVWKQKNAYDFVTNERVFGSNDHFTEQAYLSYHDDKFIIKIGKDYLDWGYSKSSFAINETVGSFSQIYLQWKSEILRFTYFTALLDNNIYFDSTFSSQQEVINRYYSASRLDVSLFDHKLNLGIWQSVLYGGKNSTLGLRYSNPIMVYYAVQWNDYEKGNLLVGTDLRYHLFNWIEVYSGAVIDDWQIQNQGSVKELIPNKWGGMIGFNFTDILRNYNIIGTEVNLELSKVTNRTFNQKTPYHRLLYGRNYIAHPLGTDFETLDITLKQWITPQLQLLVFGNFHHKGEGNLDEHTEPWLEKDENGQYIYSLETGYHENSPYGIVEKTTKLGLGFYYQPSNKFLAQLNLKRVWINNKNHIKNNDDQDWELFFKLSYEFQSSFSLL